MQLVDTRDACGLRAGVDPTKHQRVGSPAHAIATDDGRTRSRFRQTGNRELFVRSWAASSGLAMLDGELSGRVQRTGSRTQSSDRAREHDDETGCPRDFWSRRGPAVWGRFGHRCGRQLRHELARREPGRIRSRRMGRCSPGRGLGLPARPEIRTKTRHVSRDYWGAVATWSHPPSGVMGGA